jgi:S-adenosylmethionine:tRNA ribosyltransferase-isomerase
LGREEVRLLVCHPDRLTHTRFERLADYLEEGDLLVVNTSATRPAALGATWRGREITLHLSTDLDDGRWLVELRRRDGKGPIQDGAPGDRLHLVGGGQAFLDEPFDPNAERLWRARLVLPAPTETHLHRHGHPIAYGYQSRSWPLHFYQTIFARPGPLAGASAEMPSAGRPFTSQLLVDLVARGMMVATITLHAGVSSPERHEPPHPERFLVPAHTAELAELTRRRGGRVVAVGTTATRALETVTSADGRVHAGEGWTDLVLSRDRPARLVNGLITGWHPPEASHMLLLEAVAGPGLVGVAYRAALDQGYLWHEFGDSCLFLP